MMTMTQNERNQFCTIVFRLLCRMERWSRSVCQGSVGPASLVDTETSITSGLSPLLQILVRQRDSVATSMEIGRMIS